MLLLSFFCTSCQAADKEASTDDVIAKQVDQITDRVDDLGAKLSVIERMLADQERAAAGLAPEGWVQPCMDVYLEPGAPESFIAPPVEKDEDPPR